MEVVASESAVEGDADYTPQLSKIADAEPDAVFICYYYETAAPWMARELAREYEWYDWRRNREHYTPLALPDGLDADYASAYSAVFPTVVLVKGNHMVRASLYQTSENVSIPLGEWAAILAESLG